MMFYVNSYLLCHRFGDHGTVMAFLGNDVWEVHDFMAFQIEMRSDSVCKCGNKGSPRVDGDEEEEDTDDLENEFNYTDIDKQDKQQVTEEMLHTHMSYGRDGDVMMSPMQPRFLPLLTNGQMVGRLAIVI